MAHAEKRYDDPGCIHRRLSPSVSIWASRLTLVSSRRHSLPSTNTRHLIGSRGVPLSC